MEFLKDDFKYIKNLENLLSESRKLDLAIQTRRMSYFKEKEMLGYQEVFVFKNAEKIIKEEYINLESKDELLIENNIFLKSLKEVEFLLENKTAFEFKINDKNETFDYVVSNAIIINGFYFFTKDYDFKSGLENRLNSICLKKIGKNFDSLNKNDIEIIKVLTYKW